MANEYEPALYNVLSIGCVDSDIYDKISEKQKCEFRKWSIDVGCVGSKNIIAYSENIVYVDSEKSTL